VEGALGQQELHELECGAEEVAVGLRGGEDGLGSHEGDLAGGKEDGRRGLVGCVEELEAGRADGGRLGGGDEGGEAELPSARRGSESETRKGSAEGDKEKSAAKRWDAVVFGEEEENVPVHQGTMLAFFQLECVESASGLKEREDVRKGGGDPLVQVEVVGEEVIDCVLRHLMFLLNQADGKRRERWKAELEE
jgi:hypothetical protein